MLKSGSHSFPDVNDDNKNVVSGILGDVLDFLADIMFNK